MVQMMAAFILLALMLPLSIAVEQEFFINDNLDSLYSTYSLIEDAIKSDPKLGFIIMKALIPAMIYCYWIIQIFGFQSLPPDFSSKNPEKCSFAIWLFQWVFFCLLQ